MALAGCPNCGLQERHVVHKERVGHLIPGLGLALSQGLKDLGTWFSSFLAVYYLHSSAWREASCSLDGC